MSDASELQDAESSSSSVSEVAAHAAACTTRRTELERRFDALMHRRALVEANTRRGRETEGHVSRARAQTIERRIDSLRKEQAQRHHRLAAPTLLPQRPAPPRVHSDTATQLEQARAEYEAFVYGQGSTWIEHERQRVDAENRRLAALKRIEVESQTLPSQVRTLTPIFPVCHTHRHTPFDRIYITRFLVSISQPGEDLECRLVAGGGEAARSPRRAQSWRGLCLRECPLE